jgi:hypothetical protein
LGKLTVRYSSDLSFFLGSQTASRNNSNPRTKIKTPTIMTGINPIMTGPTIKTPTVKIASIIPARRPSPPVLMNRTLLVYTR